MAPSSDRNGPGRGLWRLAREQHGVITHGQLIALGLSREAIRHRVASGRLHRVRRGIYAVGRPELTALGRWMAAVLGCGPAALLSHQSAAALWGVRRSDGGTIEVTIRRLGPRRQPGVRVHRRTTLEDSDITRHKGIPVTSIVRTLLDLATVLSVGQLERAVNEADRLDLVDPEALRRELQSHSGQHGVAPLRTLVDRHTFRLTDSELERRLLEIAAGAGLPLPQTGRRLNGFKVDFFWPDLGLVVETDGLRYHRTPAQQARDRLRDQAHTAEGLTCLRFTHAQIVHRTRYVRATLLAVARRLSGAA